MPLYNFQNPLKLKKKKSPKNRNNKNTWAEEKHFTIQLMLDIQLLSNYCRK